VRYAALQLTVSFISGVSVRFSTAVSAHLSSDGACANNRAMHLGVDAAGVAVSTPLRPLRHSLTRLSQCVVGNCVTSRRTAGFSLTAAAPAAPLFSLRDVCGIVERYDRTAYGWHAGVSAVCVEAALLSTVSPHRLMLISALSSSHS
jgi:hypothetical protein